MSANSTEQQGLKGSTLRFLKPHEHLEVTETTSESHRFLTNPIGVVHKEPTTAALAKLVLQLDAENPGDPEASFDVPAKDWARMVSLARGETPRPYRVAIIACSKAKQKGTHPAKDLYTGQLFTLARELAEKTADRWFILSAAFGLVEPERELETYDASIDAAPDEWGDEVARELGVEIFDLPREQILCLAPESYVSRLPVGFAKNWARPLKGLAIGQQKAKLKKLIGGAS